MQYRAAIGRWHNFTSCRPLSKKCKIKFKFGESLLSIGKKMRPLLVLATLLACILLVCCGDIHTNPGPTNSPLSICHINSRSLCPSDKTRRIDEIHSILCLKERFDIICIGETWLKSSIPDDAVSLPDYQLFRNDRQNKMGGGVAIYVHESVPAKRRTDLEMINLEMIIVEITSHNKRFLVSCCYRAPGANANEIKRFLDNMQTVFNAVQNDMPESFFLLGDLNDHCYAWESDHKNSELGNKLLQLVNMNNIFQIIDEPTHIKDASPSLLDLILTDSPGYIIDSGTLPPIGDPYHCCIFCRVQVQVKREAAYSRMVWKYNLADVNGLIYNLSNAPWYTMDVFDDINDAVDFFQSLFLKTCKEFIPNKFAIIRPNDKPWITNHVRQNFRKRDRAHKKFKQNPNAANLQKYKEARQNANFSKMKAKENYTKKLSQKLLDPTTNTKQYWHITKELYGNKVHRGIPPIIHNDSVLSINEDKCN